MAIILVTYDLRAPNRNYQPVYDYMKRHVSCKALLSVYLLNTDKGARAIRDELTALIDSSDALFVVRLQRDWAGLRMLPGAADWLNDPARTW
jgi:hypothetical protein